MNSDYRWKIRESCKNNPLSVVVLIGIHKQKNMVMDHFSGTLGWIMEKRLFLAPTFEEAGHVLDIKMTLILHVWDALFAVWLCPRKEWVSVPHHAALTLIPRGWQQCLEIQHISKRAVRLKLNLKKVVRWVFLLLSLSVCVHASTDSETYFIFQCYFVFINKMKSLNRLPNAPHRAPYPKMNSECARYSYKIIFSEIEPNWQLNTLVADFNRCGRHDMTAEDSKLKSKEVNIPLMAPIFHLTKKGSKLRTYQNVEAYLLGG